MSSVSRIEFWIRPTGGLCNRLRVLASAIGYCEMTGRELLVTWPLTKRPRRWPLRRVNPAHRFGARVTDLWIPCFRIATDMEWQAMRSDSRSEPAGLPPDPERTATFQFLETYYAFFEILPNCPSYYIARLQLVPHLRRRFDALRNRLLNGEPNIGVHVRTIGAHHKTAEASPLGWFVDRMAEIANQQPGVRFFVSCDSRTASRELRRRFGPRVSEQTRPTGYNTRRGIQKGLIDLLLLAECDHILGSYWSSFSELAYHLQPAKSYEDAVGGVPVSQPELCDLRTLGV